MRDRDIHTVLGHLLNAIVRLKGKGDPTDMLYDILLLLTGRVNQLIN